MDSYEKKYNEAMLRADEAVQKGCLDKAIFDEIFPPEESEDERMIRKIEMFLSAYGADYFSNDEWREIENWLEKQKENPKNANSIPEDCVSSAKCEDRWHKVGDSLPDNPREVLCKDEAGNYFIGRYYTEEGWEISNYDDEDKPHHLNPPVSKWIDFPSEKQKEQKPAWSEEDKSILEALIYDIERLPMQGVLTHRPCDSYIKFLKALRPGWKPSEEQLNALNFAITYFMHETNYKNPTELRELYEQLKKL